MKNALSVNSQIAAVYIIFKHIFFKSGVPSFIQEAFDDYEAKTCLKFVLRKFEANYIKFNKGTG